MKLKVLILQVHVFMAELLQDYLRDRTDMDCTVMLYEEADFNICIDKEQPDVISLPLRALFTHNTIIERIKEKYPDKKVVVTAIFGDEVLCEVVKRLGADGYVPSNIATPKEFIQLIKDVASGEKVFLQGAPSRMIRKNFTGREKDVLYEMLEGKTNNEIGERLFISPRTVEKHRQNILRKMGASHTQRLWTMWGEDMRRAWLGMGEGDGKD